MQKGKLLGLKSIKICGTQNPNFGNYLGMIKDLELNKLYNKILSSHSGQKIDKIAKDSDRDNFMSPEEAVEYGLIDSVMATRS